MVNSFRDVIELWERRTDAARDIGVSAIVISAWHQRNSIPADRFLDVAAAAARKGHGEVTPELLSRLARARREEAAEHSKAAS